jgi:ATPase subunit of ABC transporter with duplicated ATPase domains
MKKIQDLDKDIQKHIDFAEKVVIPKFEKYNHKAEQFDKSLLELQELKERCSNSLQSKSHICLIGNTGAGKSTLINAILKLDLLPTSNHANCTAVATEIAHCENSHFVVELEFMTRAEWEKEIKTLQDYYSETIEEGEHDPLFHVRYIEDGDEEGLSESQILGYIAHSNFRKRKILKKVRPFVENFLADLKEPEKGEEETTRCDHEFFFKALIFNFI